MYQHNMWVEIWQTVAIMVLLGVNFMLLDVIRRRMIEIEEEKDADS